MFDRFVLFGRGPAFRLLGRSAVRRGDGVFGADAVGPGEVIVNLNEIVVPQYRLPGLDPPEEVHHALLQFAFETRDVAGSVDFGKRHAEFVTQAPETSEEDAAGKEVVLTIWSLKHDSEIVLDEATSGGHGVLGKRSSGDVEGFVGKEVVDASGGGAEERGVALREVRAPANVEEHQRQGLKESHAGTTEGRHTVPLGAQRHHHTLQVRSYSTFLLVLRFGAFCPHGSADTDYQVQSTHPTASFGDPS